MLYYFYDGSFDGLLTAIYQAYYRGETPSRIVAAGDFQESLLAEKVYIRTETEQSQRVYVSIQTKISRQALRNVFYVYLSELPDAGTWIYEYLRLGWKIGKEFDRMLSDGRVLRVHKISQRVNGERHRMMGLIRFRCLEGNIYYAPISPQYNIVGLVIPHFLDRFPGQNWIIHDVNRKIGVFYNGETWSLGDMDLENEIELSNGEKLYQSLWKEYFKSIAIKDRVNPKLQKRNLPVRYWRFLIEKGQ
ncbi:MAG: Domain often clustered or fused with uracil-DNA glycosylase [Firmicutes bacterium]|nr:Domain often clustered or fused with uracil-DNA glycosylase [Bacillota bacterium]MDI6705816.1 TIGR03915 family putative DNA repair protein [Bacillota bacterium]